MTHQSATDRKIYTTRLNELSRELGIIIRRYSEDSNGICLVVDSKSDCKIISSKFEGIGEVIIDRTEKHNGWIISINLNEKNTQ